MSVGYCEEHHRYFDWDFVDGCPQCQDEEEEYGKPNNEFYEEENKVRINNN